MGKRSEIRKLPKNKQSKKDKQSQQPSAKANDKRVETEPTDR